MYVTTLAYNLEVSSFKINILNIYNKMPYECNASFLFILLRPVESKPDHIFPKQLKCYKTFLFFVFFPNGMIWCHCNPFKISNNIIHLQEQAFLFWHHTGHHTKQIHEACGQYTLLIWLYEMIIVLAGPSPLKIKSILTMTVSMYRY